MSRETAEVLRSYIQEHLIKDAAVSFKDSDSLLEAGILDSMRVLDLSVFIQKKFNIKIAAGELTQENFDSVSAMEKYINGKKSAS